MLIATSWQALKKTQMNLEELEHYIEQFDLKQKSEIALKSLLDNLRKTEQILDGYLIESLTYKYVRHEIRLLTKDSNKSIIAKFDIHDKESNSRIGYYDYVVNFQGDFVDEFLVFE